MIREICEVGEVKVIEKLHIQLILSQHSFLQIRVLQQTNPDNIINRDISFKTCSQLNDILTTDYLSRL